MKKPQLKKFAMSEYTACGAANRPSYCKFDTNMCCFGCEYNEECMTFAKANGIKILPCTPDLFEEAEVCEYAI